MTASTTEDLSAELVLWGITAETYPILRDLRSRCSSITECAEYLNEQDIPPPYCEDCEICDTNGPSEQHLQSNDIDSLFRRCQTWTGSNWLQISGALGRDARERQRRSETRELLESIATSMVDKDEYLISRETVPTEETEGRDVTRWNNEEVAAKTLAALLGGSPELYDTQVGSRSSGRHDYCILLEAGRIVALEVTQIVNSSRRKQEDYIRKSLATLMSNKHDWSVRVIGEAYLGGLGDCLPEMLAKLNEFDIDELYTQSSHIDPPFVVRLRSLAVTSVHRVCTTEGPGEIRIVPANPHGATSHELVTGIANSGLHKRAKKLKKAEADERHLWVWVDGDQFVDFGAVLSARRSLPSTLPDMTRGGIGECIDVVWIAASCIDGSDGTFKTPILRCDGNHWERVTLPESVQQIITDAVERSRPQ